jgi:hypothetical protein
VQDKLEKMNKRPVPMEDGRRQIIFYTFEEDEPDRSDTETEKKGEEETK